MNDSARPLTEDLQFFLLTLRRQGFAIGVDTILKIERLAQTIAASGRGLSSPVNLCTALAPIVCKNPVDQERFRKIYTVWSQTGNTAELEDAEKQEELAREALTVDQESTESVEAMARQGRRRLWQLLAFSAIIVAAIIVLALIFPPAIGSGSLPSVPKLPQDLGQRLFNTEFLKLGVRTLMALLVFTVPMGHWWIKNKRIRILQRRFTTRTLQSRAVTLQTATQLFFTGAGVEQSFQLLRQHRTIEGQILDVSRTLSSVVQSAGLARFVFRGRRVLPEHLLLVDRYSEEDHMRGAADLLERRLREANTPVTRYEFRQDPRTLQRWNYFTNAAEEYVALKDLAARYGDHRLIVLSEGGGFVNPLTGQLRPWLTDFSAWTRRAILTPKPRLSWGEREHQLEQAGFIVAPANTSGLRTIAKAFRVAEGTDPAVTDEDPNEDGYESYPPMLEDVPSRWLEDEAPSREVLRELLLELRQFLGERGFYWCCTCAAFPKLHPELTLHLGATLTTSAGSADGSEEGLLALSRLPWFRQGFMPDWLRLALLSELTEEQKRKIRTALTDVLMTAKAGADSGLVLNISDRASSLVADFLARSTSHNDPFNPVQEEIFLSFLRGRQLPPLAIVAPPTLVQAIRRRIETVQMALWGGAAFVAGLLWWYNPWPHLLSALSFEILAGLLLATIILGLLRISCRASAERGPIVVGSWLVGGLVLIVSLVGVFEAAEIAWGGLEANDTGGVVGLLLILGSGLVLILRRWRVLSSGEVVFYLLSNGLVLVLLVALIAYS